MIKQPANRTRIKICCIASPEEARLAIAAGADALGLLAAMPIASRSSIPDETIAAIAAQVPPPVATVLLTAETTAEAIAEHVRATGPTAVQIVRQIDPAESARLATLIPTTRRIQVVHVEGPEALDRIRPYAPHIHAFLLNSGRPNTAAPVFGGTGETHDWTVSARFVEASPLPVFLAGGLNAQNVGDAIRRVRPFGLDLCTGVRTLGRLDPAKLVAFMAGARAADEEIR